MYRIDLQISLFYVPNIHLHFYTDYNKQNVYEQILNFLFILIKASIFLIKINNNILFY